MKNITLMATLGAALAFATISARAQVIVDSNSTTPLVGTVQISQPDFSGSIHAVDYIPGDDTAHTNGPGQTFTTTNAFDLQSLIFKGAGSAGGFNIGVSDLTLTIGTVSGSSFTVIGSETALFSPDNAHTSDYFEFDLATPISLAANTQYVWILDRPDGSGFFALADSGTDVLSGGDAVFADFSAGTFDNSGLGAIDRTFFLSGVESIPEPSTWALLFCGFGLLIWLRRFRGRLGVSKC